jgi:hypothetical protein
LIAALCTQVYGQNYQNTPQAYQDRVEYDVSDMQSAIDKCNRDAYDRARSDYDFRVTVAPNFMPAPEYPEPCSRKPRTTNIRPKPDSDKLYQVGTLRKPPAASFAGLYIGANVSGSFNTLGQIETFTMTNVVTNRFSDTSNALGGGFNAGLLFSPWNNNILIGTSASIDFWHQDTNHTFPPGPFFIGQTINLTATGNVQIGTLLGPNVLLYGEVGGAVVNVDHRLNFSGPVTSVNQTVPGVNVGVGAAIQPANWQVAGIPVSMFVQYNRIFAQDAVFKNPGSNGFIYLNLNDLDQFKVGLRVNIDPDAGKRLWRTYH